MRSVVVQGGILVVAAGALVAGCGNGRDAAFEDVAIDAGGGGGPEAGGGTFTPDEGCKTLECKQVQCGEGRTTTLRGKVYDPAGANPLYNVIVYVPSGLPDAELPPLADSTTSGISCEACSGMVLNPLAVTLTDTTGGFELKDVPVGDAIPVVIQVGKWRRRIEVAIPNACEDNSVPDKALKLPAKGSEGDMPQIAVATGSADSLECLLRGIGIDDSEFVLGHTSGGHVHVFNGSGGRFIGAPPAGDLWGDAATMKKYDLTLLSCEGNANVGGKSELVALPEYLDAGGRVFATHYHYVWFSQSPSTDLRTIATFSSSSGATEHGAHSVNMSFPKGEAFGRWLAGVGTSPLGTVTLNNIRNSVVDLNLPAVPWITSISGRPRYFSFNTPLKAPADQQCGRAVFSDIHLTDAGGQRVIADCKLTSGSLNEQQKALEFFLFDLSACITDDREPPTVPK